MKLSTGLISCSTDVVKYSDVKFNQLGEILHNKIFPEKRNFRMRINKVLNLV